MSYKLRIIQRFQPNKMKEFLELEALFVKLSQTIRDISEGRRYLAVSGREPGNTFIWEQDFESLDAIEKFLAFIETSPDHDELFQKQVQFFGDYYTEIYKELEL